MERTNDIFNEMRNWDYHSDLDLNAHEVLSQYADRFWDAHKREVEQYLKSIVKCDKEIARLKKVNSRLKEENSRLNEKLNPVLNCYIEKFKNGKVTNSVYPFCTSAMLGVEDSEGDPVSNESIATALNVISEAQNV